MNTWRWGITLSLLLHLGVAVSVLRYYQATPVQEAGAESSQTFELASLEFTQAAVEEDLQELPVEEVTAPVSALPEPVIEQTPVIETVAKKFETAEIEVDSFSERELTPAPAPAPGPEHEPEPVVTPWPQVELQEIDEKPDNRPAPPKQKPAVQTMEILAAQQPAVEQTASKLSTDSVIDADYATTVRALLASYQRFPTRAKRRGISGVVLLGFRIMANGQVEQGRVLNSSGHKLLDNAALSALQRIDRFPPLPSDEARRYHDFQVPLKFRIAR